MGKPRKEKRKARERPVGHISASEAEHIMDHELASCNGRPGAAISNIIDKLNSTSADEQECACNTLAMLTSDPVAVPQLIQGKAMSAMGPLLQSQHQAVKKCALGALRNMTVDGGTALCDAIVHQNCFSHLITCLRQYVPGEGTHLEDSTERVILLQALHLLWNICENSSAAVDSFSRHGVAGIIIHHYNSNYSPIALAVAWCLYTVTENNPCLTASLRENQAMMSQFSSLIQSKTQSAHGLLVRTLTAGILQNIVQNSESVLSFVELFAEVLNEDLSAHLAEIVKVAASLPAVQPTIENPIEVKSELLETMLSDMDSIVSAQQLSLEQLTNMTSNIEEDEWEDVNSDTSCDESDSRLVQPAEVEVSMETEEENSAPSLPDVIQESFIKTEILTKAVARSKLPDSEVLSSLKQHPKTFKLWKGLMELQSRALLFLSNIINTADLSVIGTPEFVSKLWAHLSLLTADTHIQKSPEQLEGVTCALRSLAQKLSSLRPDLIQQIVESDVQFLSQLALKCPNPSVRANIVRVLASMGVGMATASQDLHPLLKPIGILLCCVMSQDDSLPVVAEAVDALMDVFSEDHTDPLLTELKVIEKLNSLLPHLKDKVKKQKKELGPHSVLVNTVRSNLPRFIQYKIQRIR